MPISLINALTGAGWRDPLTGTLVKIPVASVIIEGGLRHSAAELVAGLGLGKSFILVSDAITYELLGEQIERALFSLGKVKSHIFPTGVKAEDKALSLLEPLVADADLVVAVGSGTINDLCKYASFLAKKPYIVFGTAPSMNGYGSANASITVNGHKKSLACHLPKAVFLDLDILAEAPKRLIRSGLGDSLCRSTSQADWLLSHLLLDTPYDETPFAWLRTCEEPLFDAAAALVAGDKEALKLLAATLILSGFGMVIAGGSYPASQGEHMIAHSMEMLAAAAHFPSYHGEQIGVTTLTMARLQQCVLEKKPELTVKPIPEAALIQLFGQQTGQEVIREAAKKAQNIVQMQERIAVSWGSIREKIQAVTVPEQQLKCVLEAAGAPTAPEAIGWDSARYHEMVNYAAFTRDRVTFLDII